MLFAAGLVTKSQNIKFTIMYATHEQGIGNILVHKSNQPFSGYTQLIKPIIQNEFNVMQSINVYSFGNLLIFSFICWLNEGAYLKSISYFLCFKIAVYALTIWPQYNLRKKYYDHHEAVLSVYEAHAPSSKSGIVFPPQYPVNNLPSSVEIIGFSFFMDAPDSASDIQQSTLNMFHFPSMYEKLTSCAAKGIVLIATGNDRQNLKNLSDDWYVKNCQFPQKTYSSILKSAQEQKNVLLVGGYDNESAEWDGMANHLTSEQIKKLKVKYVRGPMRHLVNRKMIGGTSLSQPYVAALLANIMEKHPGQSPEAYIEALLAFTNNSDLKAPMHDNFEALYKAVDTYFAPQP